MRFFDVSGVLQKARRFVNGGTSIQDSELSKPDRMVSVLRELLTRTTNIEAKVPPDAVEFEVNLPGAGALINLQHNLGSPVRYYVTALCGRDQETGPAHYHYEKAGFVTRESTLATFAIAVGNQTQGARWRMKVRRHVLGIRFMAASGGVARTFTCTLWNDSTGASIATASVSTQNNGVYEALFSAPVTTDLTGVDVVASYWETSGNNVPYCVDANLVALVPYETDPYATLKAPNLYAAGNAKPFNVAAGNVVYPCELILGQNVAEPQVVMDSSSDLNKLALRTYTRGKAIVRVEASQSGFAIV